MSRSRLEPPRSRALLLSLGLAIVGSAVPAHASDPWSLERRADEPELVEQRFSRLRARPFDDRQWRALRRTLGDARLAKLVERARERAPNDQHLWVLEARLHLVEGRPDEAAKLLAALTEAGLVAASSSLRVEALVAAGRHQDAIDQLELQARSRGSDGVRALARAIELAASIGIHDRAQALAEQWVERTPRSTQAWLELARVASHAGSADRADEAYAEATALSRGRERDEIHAQRARTRLEMGNPAGAASLAWQLLEPPRNGTPAEREAWWQLLLDAQQAAGGSELLVSKLERWLEATGSNETWAWRALAAAQQIAGSDPVEALRRAVASAPRDLELRGQLIEALQTKGQIDEAVAEYRAAQGRDVQSVQLGLQLATRLTEAGKHQRALEVAALVERRAGRDPASLMLLLDFYNLSEEPEQALEVAHRLVRVAPRNPEARIALGEQLYQMGQVQEALTQWQRIPSLIRPTHSGHARHAQVLSEHGRITEAVASLKRALDVAADNPEYVRLRAVLAEQQRRPTMALELWERVRELSRDERHRVLRDEARTRVVELLVGGAIPKRHGRLERAEAEAQTILQRGTPIEDAVEAGRFLAELYTRRELYGAAVTVQQRLLQLEPDAPDRYEQLATAQRRAGQVGSALGTLEELLDAAPKQSAEVLAEMSELSFEAGDAQAALAHATEAAEQDRRHLDALVRLGELHERRGDLERAEQAYARALETSPSHTVALLKLAELAVVRGQPDHSLGLLRQVLERGGPPELVREAGRRALDLAQASSTTMQWVEFAVERTAQRPEADEPREFLLEALDRTDARQVESWLRADANERDATREQELRAPLVAALARGSVSDRLRASEHLGRLKLPDTAVPLVRLARSLTPPRHATETVREGFERARLAAIRAAGTVADPAAITEVATLLHDPEQPAETRHQAAWALAHIDAPEAAHSLASALTSNGDPTLAAFACVALARHPRAQVDPRVVADLSAVAREHHTARVRHVCAFAEAALTPDERASALVDALHRSDPMLAAIAAWRLGAVQHPSAPVWEALFRRYLGPPGLARDAAGAALVSLLTREPSEHAPDDVPPPPRGSHATTTTERWLRARVAPPYASVEVERLEPHRSTIARALASALEGTRAERTLARQIQTTCPGEARASTPPGLFPLCLAPLTEATVWVPPPKQTPAGGD